MSVTCRDWFQLSLKEGLTVFRDQEFSSDLGSRTVKRIGDVSKLRIYQFSQDAGPMAHPVRPHSYIKMDNFYTVTVYEKGAEVVRMYKTLLGSEGFRKGTDLYFQRHDGQAVTCEDFYAAMRDANDADFANFLLWYSQAGTPSVKVTSSYNAEARTFSLKFSQTVPPTPGQLVKEPMFIPVAAGLLDSSGNDMPLSSIYHDGKLETVTSGGQPVYTTVLRVTKGEEEFVFNDVPEKPVPSLLRGYSAPIRLHSDLTESDLFFLLAHDSDEFNRWEAGQILARNLMLTQVVNFQKGNALVLDPQFVHGIKCIILDSSLDKEFVAKAITLPGEGEIMDMMEIADPDAFTAQRHYRLPHPGQGILGPAPAIYASKPTTLPSAFSTMPLQDPTWHMDTGASSHLNFNSSNLSTIFTKRLVPSVHVGDGKSIPVTNTGHSIIPSHHRPLHLHNVLVTPNIIKNLISVRQFTRDNNCTIEFDAFGFSVKDYLTRHMLLRCDSSGDLYPVTKIVNFSCYCFSLDKCFHVTSTPWTSG
nr:puromycin-sensitive aminopeptidase-like isoform X2 [Tanacetum cinerariifolium]